MVPESDEEIVLSMDFHDCEIENFTQEEMQEFVVVKNPFKKSITSGFNVSKTLRFICSSL